MVSLMEDLARQEKMDSSQPGPRFKQGQGVDNINLDEVTPRRWELCREFGKRGCGPGEIYDGCGIAAGRHDEIALADRNNRRVQIFGVDGTYKCQIDVGDNRDQGPLSVAFAKQSNRLIVVCKTHVNMFNQDNSLAFQFSTLPTDESVSSLSVAVREDGNLLVGDAVRKVVTEHTPTGALIRTIPVGIMPIFLAAHTDGRLIIGTFANGIVYVFDSDGTTLFSIKPTIGGQPVYHCPGVWSDHSGIYVVSYSGFHNCHIHHYDAQGAFLACIAQGLYNPQGITMTPAGQLAVLENGLVKIYHQSSN